MSVKVQGSVPDDWSEQTAAHISRRLIALERAFGGESKGFVAPAYPSFGSGVPQGSGGGTTIVTGGTTVTQTTIVPETTWHRSFLLMGA